MNVLLLVCLCSLICFVGCSFNETSHWIFLHYHKTGHVLSETFAHIFRDQCDASVLRLKHDFTLETLNKTNDVAILLVARHHFFHYCDWKKIFNSTEHSHRIIHFVRDPYDLVVSGLVYHSQYPIPHQENFLSMRHYQLCNYSISEILSRHVPILAPLRNKINADGSKVNGSEVITAQILAAAQLCNELWYKSESLRFDRKGNTSYSYFLRHANDNNIPNLAIKIEAIRALLPSSADQTGDLLIMASNAMFEDKSISKRIFTSEFPIGDRQQWINTTTSMYEFLLKDAEKDEDESFRRCKTVQQAVNASEKVAFIPKISSYNGTKSQHVTAGMITPEQKQAYISVLKNDPILSPLLNLVADALKVYH